MPRGRRPDGDRQERSRLWRRVFAATIIVATPLAALRSSSADDAVVTTLCAALLGQDLPDEEVNTFLDKEAATLEVSYWDVVAMADVRFTLDLKDPTCQTNPQLRSLITHALEAHLQAATPECDGLRGVYDSGATTLRGRSINRSALDDFLAVWCPPTVRVSVRTSESLVGGGQSEGARWYDQGPDTTPDARYIVFSSDAADLVTGDLNEMADVFLRDRLLATTTRVSVGPHGIEAQEGDSYIASISDDGRLVTFESDAINLVVPDLNKRRDIFVRDLVAETTSKVSVGHDGGEANNDSMYATVSGDGRCVAFASYATNLVPGDVIDTTPGVYLRDLSTGVTTRVAQAGLHPAITPDCTKVAYTSFFHVYAKDLSTGSVTQVSVTNSGGPEDWFSHFPDISADGRYVAFRSLSTNLVAGDTNALPDIFLRDLLLATTIRISVSTSGQQSVPPSYGAGGPSISRDGRYVAFDSDAANLAFNDTNGSADVFVRDWQDPWTGRLSLGETGNQGDADSRQPSIAGSASHVIFQSDAANLVAGDTNFSTDVFVRELN